MKIRYFFLFIFPALLPAQTSHPPTGLMCELLRDPAKAIITDPKPEFSWIVNDSSRGAVQTGYQILVSSNPATLDQNRADMWDSGKVLSAQSVNIEYEGQELLPDHSYWWKVRTWDGRDQPAPCSTPQEFKTGKFARTDLPWPAKSRWIKTGNGEWLLENRQRPEYRSIRPVKTRKKTPFAYYFDFGKAAFATLQFSLKTAATGDSAIVFLGERRTGDSAVHKNPGVSNIGYKRIPVALKTGTHTYTVRLPRFVSHYPNSQVLAGHMAEVIPFRYAEIHLPDAQLDKSSVRQLALFYYFDDNASEFECSSQNLNKVWDLCKYTLKATPFLALYADGNRERMPYEADAYIQQLGHYSVDREYSIARYTNQFLIFNPSWPTEWQMHTVFMAWADYIYTGNPESVTKYYRQLEAKTLVDLTESNGLISTRTGKTTPGFFKSIYYNGNRFGDIVDWPKGTPAGEQQKNHQGPTPLGERDGYVFTDYNTVVNAFHYRSLVLMSRLALATGNSAESRSLKDRAQQVKKSINTLLFDKNRGVYVDGTDTGHASLHANMFPLAFGLVPDEHTASVVQFIKSRGMACSVYGAQYLLEALYNAGEARYALDLMTSESKRSWMNMVRVGSTMTTEAWDAYYKPNLTWNHAWGSAPANIIVRKLFGIEALEPAFRLVKIHPQPANLEYARLKTPTIRGPIICEWSQKNARYDLYVRLPANTKAHLYLPAGPIDDIYKSGTPLEQKKGVPTTHSDNYSVFCIAAGEHRFSGPYIE